MFRLTVEKDVARLTLDRPEARNAIPLPGWDALADRLTEAEASPARLLVVEGAGGAFCAGADLKDFGALQQDDAARSNFRLAMRRALNCLAELKLPTIAKIDGPCYGAGVALAMACDLRLAGPDARFAITPAKLGISYPQEDVARLVRLVGPGQAARLLFTGLTIDAEEAARIGLVELRGTEADQFVAGILANAPESLVALKRGIKLAERGIGRDEGQDRLFDTLFGSPDLAARLKRKGE